MNKETPRAAMKKCSFNENLRFIFFNTQNTKIMIEDKKKR